MCVCVCVCVLSLSLPSCSSCSSCCSSNERRTNKHLPSSQKGKGKTTKASACCCCFVHSSLLLLCFSCVECRTWIMSADRVVDLMRWVKSTKKEKRRKRTHKVKWHWLVFFFFFCQLLRGTHPLLLSHSHTTQAAVQGASCHLPSKL